jgi:hypothetical protein
MTAAAVPLSFDGSTVDRVRLIALYLDAVRLVEQVRLHSSELRAWARIANRDCEELLRHAEALRSQLRGGASDEAVTIQVTNVNRAAAKVREHLNLDSRSLMRSLRTRMKTEHGEDFELPGFETADEAQSL